eukprot:CAMPEP_0184537230 /NCGR_PEP_ID=MMETSP0198_2-20121128/16914_1 /TAXON_ID=1112570 /ORGANISM="Thraustochytrium sp., Strain LLF1b" /LENGTH=297 /DNA_ID=CAMNT_0026930529 /DNA_START=1828 /DNA_END=2721 /DNA_ORIENTATION=+
MTYNVCRFHGNLSLPASRRRTAAEDTLDAVCQELQELKPCVVCLNEVDLDLSPDAKRRVGEALGVSENHVVFFGHAKGGKYGNLIASRYPVASQEQVHLAGGTELIYPPGSGKRHRIVRGLLVCQISPPATTSLPSFSIAATHLDHISEQQRRIQIEHVINTLDQIDHPIVLCGDLNAFHREDYSHEEWAAIEQRHVKHGWAQPQHGCLDLLLSRRYADAYRAASPLGLAETGRAKCTAPTEEPCIRIDYCFLSEKFQQQFAVERSFVHHGARHSDHLPLVVDLAFMATRNSIPAQL